MGVIYMMHVALQGVQGIVNGKEILLTQVLSSVSVQLGWLC